MAEITEEEFQKKLDNPPYEDSFREFLERKMTEYYKSLIGEDVNISVDEFGNANLVGK